MTFSVFRHWFTRAEARNGEAVPNQTVELIGPEEQFQMGLKFAGGLGATPDFVQAAHCYTQAAEQNHGLAQLNLAMLYGQGQGVARDKQKSLLWLTRSAKQGNATAQYQLGVQQHLACRKDSSAAVTEVRIEALKWVQLSAAQGCRHADIACEFIALGMTREEVAESGRRAAAFIVG